MDASAKGSGIGESVHEHACSLGRQSARAEALGLYRMLGHDENTIEAIRELIAVPVRTERVLLAYARVHAEDAHWIEACLKFRSQVLQEFERLVREGVPVAELSEEEESELDAAEETYAIAQP